MSAAASPSSCTVVTERVADVYESRMGLRPQPLVLDSPTSSTDEPVAQQLTGVWAGVAAGRGKKRYMEDVSAIHSLHPDQGVLQQSDHTLDSTLLAGVYDGHGGRSTAAYAAAQLPLMLQQQLRNSNAAAVDHQQLLSSVSHQLDQSWADQGHVEQSGSTAVTALINKNNLLVANAGDSVAVLARSGSSRCLSRSHKLCCPDELARVTAAGGLVATDKAGKPRLMQSQARWQKYVAPMTLAVTRGFRDYGFKGVGGDLVIPTPHIQQLELIPDDQVLLLTSDGVTDVMGDDDMMEVAMKAISKARNDTDIGNELATAAAAAVKHTAAAAGAWDNMTVLAILLNWGS
eukprot:GHUV01009809.1.p1 GENE.GHUV01009809.1~~GHUV01009809.1.p1  ORF type:complete len:346 (+),score=145.49 GHUV01009809.1:861-1898(+)